MIPFLQVVKITVCSSKTLSADGSGNLTSVTTEKKVRSTHQRRDGYSRFLCLSMQDLRDRLCAEGCISYSSVPKINLLHTQIILPCHDTHSFQGQVPPIFPSHLEERHAL